MTKTRTFQLMWTGVAFGLLLCVPALGQEEPLDRLTVPLSDPSRPAVVKANLVQGGITVKGYEGSEVIVEARRRSRKGRSGGKKSAGLRRIEVLATGLSIEEENNEVKIDTGHPNKTVDLDIQVPQQSSLKLGCVNSGHITVEHVSGEIEVNNVNGRITVTDVSGAVVAHTVNGGVKVTFREVTPDKLMSFSTLNGDIEVAFPSDFRATVKMQSDRGEIYTDFDIEIEARRREPIVEDSREGRGRYRVRTENAMYGNINGGGPEISFKTFNGSIYIRKAN